MLPLVEVRASKLWIIRGLPKSWWKSTGGPWLCAAAIWLVRFEGGIQERKMPPHTYIYPHARTSYEQCANMGSPMSVSENPHPFVGLSIGRGRHMCIINPQVGGAPQVNTIHPSPETLPCSHAVAHHQGNPPPKGQSKNNHKGYRVLVSSVQQRLDLNFYPCRGVTPY